MTWNRSVLWRRDRESLTSEIKLFRAGPDASPIPLATSCSTHPPPFPSTTEKLKPTMSDLEDLRRKFYEDDPSSSDPYAFASSSTTAAASSTSTSESRSRPGATRGSDRDRRSNSRPGPYPQPARNGSASNPRPSEGSNRGYGYGSAGATTKGKARSSDSDTGVAVGVGTRNGGGETSFMTRLRSAPDDDDDNDDLSISTSMDVDPPPLPLNARSRALPNFDSELGLETGRGIGNGISDPRFLDVRRLARIWMNERHAPDILPHKQEFLDHALGLLQTKVRHSSSLFLSLSLSPFLSFSGIRY